MRRYCFAFRPRWLLLHLIVAAAAVTMVFLGRWQLHVSEAKHFSLQNFGYSLQWWAFSAFAVVLWVRILRDAARRGGTMTAEAEPEGARAPDELVAYRRYVMPTTSAPPSDPVHAAYNDYLAELAARDARNEHDPARGTAGDRR